MAEIKAPDHHELYAAVTSAGATPHQITTILEAGVPWITLISLVFQYGPKAIAIILDVINVLKSGTVDFSKLQELYAKDWPIVVEIYNAIKAILKPTAPGIPVNVGV